MNEVEFDLYDSISSQGIDTFLYNLYFFLLVDVFYASQ